MNPPPNPLDVACPACQAPAGKKCTTPTDTSRRPVAWTHFARDHRALAAARDEADE